MPDVLNQVAYSRVVVEGWNGELPWELTLQDLFRERERESEILAGESSDYEAAA